MIFQEHINDYNDSVRGRKPEKTSNYRKRKLKRQSKFTSSTSNPINQVPGPDGFTTHSFFFSLLTPLKFKVHVNSCARLLWNVENYCKDSQFLLQTQYNLDTKNGQDGTNIAKYRPATQSAYESQTGHLIKRNLMFNRKCSYLTQ